MTLITRYYSLPEYPLLGGDADRFNPFWTLESAYNVELFYHVPPHLLLSPERRLVSTGAATRPKPAGEQAGGRAPHINKNTVRKELKHTGAIPPGEPAARQRRHHRRGSRTATKSRNAQHPDRPRSGIAGGPPACRPSTRRAWRGGVERVGGRSVGDRGAEVGARPLRPR